MLGNNIETLRKSYGFTQEALASNLNNKFDLKINKSMISKWENNKETPSLDNIKYIAIIFNVSLDSLLNLNSERVLDNEESQLIDSYRQLNKEGQEKVLDYTEDLASSGRYIKNSETENVQNGIIERLP